MELTADDQKLRSRAEAGDAQAAYQWGYALSTEARYDESRFWLQRAASQGVADALAWLGLHVLYGYAVDVDYSLALERLLTAEKQQSVLASYHLALMGWCDQLVSFNSKQMAQRLVFAAEHDHVESLRALSLIYAHEHSVSTQNFSDACLARAAALGDSRSFFLYGKRLLQAVEPQSVQLGRSLMAMANLMGVSRAARYVDAQVKPVRLSAPRLQQLPLPQFELHVNGAFVRHSQQPLLETMDHFLLPEECDYLILCAEPYVRQSVTVADDGAHYVNPERSSSDINLLGTREDFACRWAQARMAQQIGVRLAQCEPLTILRYRPGEEYRPHFDYLAPGTYRNNEVASEPGQRVHTIFTYLTDVEAGGATVFPRLGKQIWPAQGRIVHFRNLDDQGQADARTLHAGAPVQAGEKWLATSWSRQRTFRAY
jgi:prolyl 4-hydroxylase